MNPVDSRPASRPVPMSPGPVVVGIAGTGLDARERELLMHPAVGGVILFSRNYADPASLGALCAEIRGLRDPALVIQVDQEGGRVQRFRAGFTPLPALSILGRWHASRPDRARDLAYRHGRVMAAEVLDAGVDQSLAPVLDLDGVSDVIGDRAMAADPETVADLAGFYLAGMHDAGMAACAKHFPGHGSVRADSHHQVVTDPRPASALEADLLPFRQHLEGLPSIMMAHVVYPAVDDVPAGFSRAWVSRLREDLGYSGTIITDDLDMAGAATAGDLSGRLTASLEAGCDLALVCRPESALGLLEWPRSGWPDAGAAVRRLRGKPQFSLEEQLTVPEFRAWRESLAKL